MEQGSAVKLSFIMLRIENAKRLIEAGEQTMPGSPRHADIMTAIP